MYADGLFEDQQYRRALVQIRELTALMIFYQKRLLCERIVLLFIFLQHYYKESTKILAQAQHSGGREMEKVCNIYTELISGLKFLPLNCNNITLCYVCM